MMQIVITDGDTLNPGDLDWTPLSHFGEIVYYDSTPRDQVAERCAKAHIIVTNKTPVDANTISAAANCQLIAVTATGYNIIDIEAARKSGITVCNVPEYGTYSVAQHAFALILELVNHAGAHAIAVRNDEWAARKKWTYSNYPIMELKNKTLGIVGFGRIGKRVAEIAKAFGMHIKYNNRSTVKSDIGLQVSMEQLFSECDIISLHCPLTPENTGFVNKSYLKTMKPSALLINTSRGQLINENDLFNALQNGWLAGAGLDVLSEEPPPFRHPLVHHPKCIITPHNAWISFEARSRMMKVTVENIKKFLDGNPQNVVS